MKTPEKLGPYRIEGVLGKGGMGRVYRAEHTETGEAVAIKSLSPQLAMNDGFIERFRAEIESLRMLRHASIVRLFGYGQEGETLFYAMELVDGPSLEDELRNGRRFDWREVTDIAVQVCRALKHAHDHGVIHRDIKPANILLTPEGKVKLADFGIARLFGGSHLTIAGGVIGTADYMAPEQVAGAAVTAQCDQYSLGGVMYALLAGRPPFVAKSLPEMLQMQRYAEPEPVRRFASGTPTQLEEAIAQMLNKAPGDRFPNTLVLAKHLEAMRLALSRAPEVGGDEGEPPHVEATLMEAHGPPRTTRDYAPNATVDSSTGESIVVVDDHDADLTPAASALMTGREPDEQATLPIGGVGPAAEPPTPRSLFLEVEAEQAADTLPRWMIAAQAAAAIALLAAIGWFATRLLAPRGADRLHAAIEQTLAPGDEASLRAVEDDVAEFLDRFPDDPRAADLRPVQEAIDVARLERRLTTKLLLGIGADAGAPPVEQLYLAAMQHAKTNPGLAAEQLAALTRLLPSGDAPDGGDETLAEFAQLARRQTERLQAAAEEEAATHRPFVEAQIRRARALTGERPDKAREFCEAVITLYADRPWAAELVAEARGLLEENPL